MESSRADCARSVLLTQLRRKTFLAATTLLLLADWARAQAPDYQLRIVTHAQLIKHHHGLAAWAILPNVADPPTRSLLLAGWAYRRGSAWIEVMGGAALTDGRGPAYEISMRLAGRPARALNVFGEVEYSFTNERLLLQQISTVPIPVDRPVVQMGVEADLLSRPGPNLVTAGPRVVVPVRVCRAICSDLSIATALRFQSDGRRVLRQYVVVRF